MLGARMAPLYTRPAECGQVLPSLANARRAARLIEQRLMQVDDFAERQVPHQARRLYSSWFFCKMRAAAARKSASGVDSRSANAARARSSGVNECTD